MNSYQWVLTLTFWDGRDGAPRNRTFAKGTKMGEAEKAIEEARKQHPNVDLQLKETHVTKIAKKGY